MQNRRKFIKQSAIFSLGIAFLPVIDLKAAKNSNRLVILHTNDFHSRFEPFPENHRKWPNKGGISRLTSLIEKVRVENEHVLLLDSGDVFQGTPYFNIFRGHPELEWIQKMNYDATTIGNHDFDLGIDHLAEIRSKYQTPTLNCNYKINHSGLKELIKPYKIIQKGPLKIGITAVGIELQGLLAQSAYNGLTYQDPTEELQKTVNTLRNNKGCDFVIVLSHLGYSYESNKIDDLKLAKNTKGIDLILGGHTHTFLDKPTKIINQEGKTVLVNQAGWAGIELGQIIFTY